MLILRNLSIHNQIQSLEIVKDIYKTKLTDKVSTLKLSLAGSIEAFKFALKKFNYSLINNDTGYELVLKWFIWYVTNT